MKIYYDIHREEIVNRRRKCYHENNETKENEIENIIINTEMNIFDNNGKIIIIKDVLKNNYKC